MRFLRKNSNEEERQGEFKPEDRERSILDSWIDNRNIPFIGNENEKGLKDLIMEAKEIDENKKPLIVEWAQRERGLRERPSGERTDF
jgi:hypothetical protein